MTQTKELDQITARIQAIIAEVTGNDLDDLTLHAHLVDELNVTEHTDLPRIITKINETFDINLNSKEISEEIETIRDLSLLVRDETVLG